MTTIHDLGPLEQAVLRALVLAESIDAPLSRASVWRTLPGYRTALPNVRAALQPGAPLREFVRESKDRFVLQDRGPVLRDLATRQGRADELWRDLKRKMRGLCKLPCVDAVGIGGHMAWGVRADGAPIDLVIIADSGRVPLARAAVRAWRKASRTKAVLRIAAVLDADELALPAGDQDDAWWLLAVRPVSNEDAFHRLWDANPWAGELFPNFDTEVTGGLPEYLVADRLDGRLAVVLRRGGWEEGLQRAVADRPIARACREWVDDQGGVDVQRGLGIDAPRARFDARWGEVASWTFGEVEPQASVVAAPVVSAPEAKAAIAPTAAVEAAPSIAPESRDAAPLIPSRRRRGARSARATGVRAKRGRRSPASPESGQRSSR